MTTDTSTADPFIGEVELRMNGRLVATFEGTVSEVHDFLDECEVWDWADAATLDAAGEPTAYGARQILELLDELVAS